MFDQATEKLSPVTVDRLPPVFLDTSSRDEFYHTCYDKDKDHSGRWYKNGAEYHNDVVSTFDKAAAVMQEKPVFGYLLGGNPAEAMRIMKKEGVVIKERTPQEEKKLHIAVGNKVSVKNGVLLVSPEFVEETDKGDVCIELVHEYAAWLADTKKLTQKGIYPRERDLLRLKNIFKNLKNAMRKNFTFVHYIMAIDNLFYNNFHFTPQELPLPFIQMWEET